MIDKTIEGPSKILSKKWRDNDMNIHKQKVIGARPYVNVEGNLKKINKSKTDQLQEEKFTEIERENRILFEKISKIKMKYPLVINQGQGSIL